SSFKSQMCWLRSVTRITYLFKFIGYEPHQRLTLRAGAGAVQNGLRPICHSIAAYLRLEVYRVYR
ncbi:hypothetical protein ACP1PL_004356, partial [Yersinia enterocolitica]